VSPDPTFGDFEREAGMRKALRAPFPKSQIGKLPRTAKRPELDYVGHAAVTDRLNAFAPGWHYTVLERLSESGTTWVHIAMTIGGLTREEYGDGSDPKEALGNAIRRGAMRFGVAIDLWSKEELSGASAGPVSDMGKVATGPAEHTSEAGTRVAGTGTAKEPTRARRDVGTPASEHSSEPSDGTPAPAGPEAQGSLGEPLPGSGPQPYTGVPKHPHEYALGREGWENCTIPGCLASRQIKKARTP